MINNNCSKLTFCHNTKEVLSMKQYNKNIFIVAGNNKEIEKETLQEAQEIKEFLEEIYNINCTIEERQKTVYEIEKGDRVYWLKDGKPDTNRIDIVTKVTKNAWGDKQYLTKELNGSKTGSAYESYICLAM